MLSRISLFLLCACGDKADEGDSGEGSGVAPDAPAAVAGDWEGGCYLADIDIIIDMVLNQDERDLTGGADIFFTDKKLEEYAGSITGTVTANSVNLSMDFTDYGTITGQATFSEDAKLGERLLGDCTAPQGSGSLTLAR